ncbi:MULTISPECIES: Y-family DNA polymerase [Cupriavidus]|uniref:DNA polymerase, Y family n=3 Tax=Cupriavidus TaxID=106589 RepID=B2AJW9_CUPTR|nr:MULTISPECIES: DNA polymerase Y family protein [Cupriavidus]MCO4865679.1 DNA polymerase Y family protein [Cupriavidus sp. WGlv3]MCO4893453.1 DNA polymerase Y family protein [Cupriavidus sp. WGtm5]ULX55989.1 DNA polymerase [Cupriavidus taiwanensis]CAP63796.1 putative DNA polymerase, Y family [Cupriavidus taiwanensis LMG 19424]SPC24084.1 putative DNA polymerase, Y family [Cupriavidus taiwanensis]
MLRLWICLRLPSLPLEVFRPTWSTTELAVAVLDKERVHLATPLALAAGVKPGMRRGGVQTIAPAAILFDRDAGKEEDALARVTMATLQFSPNVAAADEAAVLIDVSTTLRLFGGPRKLRRRIMGTVQTMGFSTMVGSAPTAQGAWLLARTGGGTALTTASLQRRMAGLPIHALPAARKFADWFEGLGCLTLEDLRRLPRAGLQRRCGADFLDALDRAYGEAPEIFEWVEAPPAFDATVDLPDRIENAEQTLAYVRGLLVQMVGWLTARHLAIKRFHVALRHERGRAAIPPTTIEIALAEPNWHEEHLIRILKERLALVVVEAPMIAVAVSAIDTEPMAPPTESLFPEPGGTHADHARLLELLSARLGADRVRQPCLQADYRPEVANAWRPATEKPARVSLPAALPRPTWLLGKPVPLIERDHRPFYGSPLHIVSPPERIEAGWWGGQVVTRDYFVAQGKDHTCYWIFQERMGSREGDESRWYLHGLFG